MNDRGRTSRALAHSGFDNGDYIFINPRQVVRVLKANKNFIIMCTLSALLLAFLHQSFLYVPIFVSESKLKVEPKSDSMSITPLLERFQQNEQLFTRTSAVLEEVQSEPFLNLVVANYLKEGNKISFIVPAERVRGLILFIKAALKKGAKLEDIQKHRDWIELRGYFRAAIESFANFETGIITIRIRTRHKDTSFNLAHVASEALVDRNFERLKEKVYRLKDFVGRQTSERKKILEDLEQHRVELQRKHEVGNTQEYRREVYQRYGDVQSRLTEIERAVEINRHMEKHTESELKKIKENIVNPQLSSSELFLSQNQHRMELLQYQKALLENDTSPDSKTRKDEIQSELDTVAQNLQKAIQEADQSGNLTFVSPQEYYKNLENTLVKLKEESRKLETEKSTLNARLKADKSEISKIPHILQEFEALQRQISVSSDLYLGLQQKLQEIEIMDAGISNDVQIITAATQSSSPIGLPFGTRLFTSGLVGLFMGLIILVLKNTFIHTVRNYREMQEEGITVIGEVPILPGLNPPIASFLGKNFDRMIGQNLGSITDKMARLAPGMIKHIQKVAPNIISNQIEKVIPHLSKIQNQLGLKPRDKVCELVVIDKPNSNEADIFRYMRLRLNAFVEQNLKNIPKEKGKVIMITSPTESLGKTFISTNLAASFGKGEIKTLLVDLDLRNSSVSRTYPDFKGVPGVETAVKTKTSFEDYVISVSKYFDVLLCRSGLENPTDVLESLALRDFIEKMRDKYDYIFLDTAPALVVCDPSLIAPIADLILMVAGFEITFREDIALAIEGLNAGKAHPIVGILNLVDSGFDRYGYGYGSGYGNYGKKAG
ncbi:MAG: hypothetical protein A4S09_00405 [Proteobacteria bacterium SG_bin7]|nr:MAG: hypothetical protein A4S09_00405 [Proteobacteria bacterium SG_bin7]